MDDELLDVIIIGGIGGVDRKNFPPAFWYLKCPALTICIPIL